MLTNLERRCADLIAELGLGQDKDIINVEPLTGGVASDIARVSMRGRELCVKFALAKLKVAEDWQAPVHRNAAEYAWLQVASNLLSEGGVKLFGRSETLNGFAMEFLSDSDVYLWKAALLSEAQDLGEAHAVGEMLGKIHAASANADFDTSAFQNRNDFQALRIEPYLMFTASRYPELDELHNLAVMLYNGDKVLVHGDVSPKNVFFRGATPIVLDAECATMGDASFDPSFCLNHIVLKAVHLPESRARLLANVADFWNAYSPYVNWEDADQLEHRVCRLVPALMLARVDGKSPVEYLTSAEQDTIRKISISMFREPCSRLTEVVSYLKTTL